jgi:hypothetical protein
MILQIRLPMGSRRRALLGKQIGKRLFTVFVASLSLVWLASAAWACGMGSDEQGHHGHHDCPHCEQMVPSGCADAVHDCGAEPAVPVKDERQADHDAGEPVALVQSLPVDSPPAQRRLPRLHDPGVRRSSPLHLQYCRFLE